MERQGLYAGRCAKERCELVILVPFVDYPPLCLALEYYMFTLSGVLRRMDE